MLERVFGGEGARTCSGRGSARTRPAVAPSVERVSCPGPRGLRNSPGIEGMRAPLVPPEVGCSRVRNPVDPDRWARWGRANGDAELHAVVRLVSRGTRYHGCVLRGRRTVRPVHEDVEGIRRGVLWRPCKETVRGTLIEPDRRGRRRGRPVDRDLQIDWGRLNRDL